MTITKALIGVAIGLVLLAAGCSKLTSPSGRTTNLSQPTVAPAVAPTPPTTPAAAVAPQPNPLPMLGPGGTKDYAGVPGADVTANGAAATIHGSVAAGQVVFTQNCQFCHGVEGKAGIPNINSADGVVPLLNPIDPGFAASGAGDTANFASGIDLYIQHGSLPAGPSPKFSMAAWGDQNRLTQQQIADVEAYVMQLNGVTWPAK